MSNDLRIGWKTYNSPSFISYREYYIGHEHGYDCFLFLGPFHFRWWVDMTTRKY